MKDVTATKIINDSHYATATINAAATIRTSFSGLNLKQLGKIIPTTIVEDV